MLNNIEDFPIHCQWCNFTCVGPCSVTGFNPQGCKNYTIVQQVKKINMAHDIGYNTPRSKLLDEVMEIVHKDRNANYGNPENNFQQIADLWNAYFDAVKRNRIAAIHAKGANLNGNDVSFNPHDVAIMNMLIKVARLAKNPQHHDSVVDIAGYAACLADVQESAKADGSPSA